MNRALPINLLALLSLASTVAADVLTVDDDGPADFASIGAAVSAAAAWDTIVVSPGTYLDETILVDKSLTISDTDAGGVIVGGELTFWQLSAGEQATVRGLRNSATTLFRILVAGCDGTAWIEDCAMGAGADVLFANTPLWVNNSTNVVVLDSSAIVGGAPSIFFPTTNFAAIESHDSILYLHDSLAEGGEGPPGECFLGSGVGFTGPPAAYIVGGTAFFFSSEMRGGVGGEQDFLSGCIECLNGRGGSAIQLVGDAEAFANHTLTIGGPPGDGSCSPGATGLSTELSAEASFEVLVGLERSLDAPGLANAGAPISIDVHAQAGDTTFVYGSLTTSLTPLVATLDNVGLIAPAIYLIGSTAAPSPASIGFTFPPLPAGVGLTGYFQGISVTTLGLPRLTAPAATTFLGS